MLPGIFGENLFDELFDHDFPAFPAWNGHDPLYGKHARNLMKTDVRETDSTYEVDVDLPGFNKDEIKLDLNNGYLTISTEKSLNKENKGKMLRQERYVGTMQRSFYVGESITEDDIKAKFENGVLSLMIPKKEAPKVPEKKQILIEG